MNDEHRDLSIPDGNTIFTDEQHATVLASEPEKAAAAKIAGPRDAQRKKKKT